MALLITILYLTFFGLFPGNQDMVIHHQFLKQEELATWEVRGKVFSNDGLILQADGGIASVTNEYATAIGERVTEVTFQFREAQSIFGVGFNDFEQMGFGTLAVVDGINNQIRLMAWNGDEGYSESEGAMVSGLKSSLKENNWYTLAIEKQFGKNTLSLTDTKSKVLATLSCDQGEEHCKTGRQWGQTVIFCKSGAVSIKDFRVSIPDRKPDLLILGDSNVEGPVILKEDYRFSWAYLLKEYSDLSIAIAGRGGDESINLLKRLDFELGLLKPRMVMLAIGTNDNDHDTWRRNMRIIIERIEMAGAYPLLCTLFPKPSQVEKTIKYNMDIRSGYFGPYSYMDLCSAVSEDPDGRKWAKPYDSGDQVHASIEGMEAVFKYLKSEYRSLLKIVDHE